MATKAQHYVWRGYLKRWTDNNTTTGSIYVYRKRRYGKQQIIDYDSIVKLGFEKFYYDMTNFADEDVKWLEKFIECCQKNRRIKYLLNHDELPNVKQERDYMENIMCVYEDIENKNNFLDKIINNDMDFFKDSPIWECMDRLNNCIIKSLLCNEVEIEDKELSCMLKNAIDNHTEYKYDFLRFFFMQYMRAPQIRNRLLLVYNDYNKRSNHKISDKGKLFCMNYLSILDTELIADNLTEKFYTWLIRIENKSDMEFITTDTPIINLTNDDKAEVQEFYYPLSPMVAIKLCISPKTKYMQNDNIIINKEDDVLRLNNKLMKMCKNEVYSKSKDALYLLLNV